MSEDTELPDLRYVRELAKVFKQYGLDEIEIETSGSRILLRRGGSGVPVATTARPEPVALPEAVNVAPGPADSAPRPDTGADDGQFITSPFVGTFYSSPRPDADTFVKVGQTVSEGDTVCIIEAMKLFNEIESEFPCVIEEMLVENAQPVEYGAKLFRVRRL